MITFTPAQTLAATELMKAAADPDVDVSVRCDLANKLHDAFPIGEAPSSYRELVILAAAVTDAGNHTFVPRTGAPIFDHCAVCGSYRYKPQHPGQSTPAPFPDFT